MITSHTEVPGGAVVTVRVHKWFLARGFRTFVATREVEDAMLEALGAEGYTEFVVSRSSETAVSATAPDGTRHRWTIELAGSQHAVELEAAGALPPPRAV